MERNWDRIPLASMEELNVDGSPLPPLRVPTEHAGDSGSVACEPQRTDKDSKTDEKSKAKKGGKSEKDSGKTHEDSKKEKYSKTNEDSKTNQDSKIEKDGKTDEEGKNEKDVKTDEDDTTDEDSKTDEDGKPVRKKRKKRVKKPPPADRLNLVFLIFLLHGIGTLMPWNMFITAESYFVDYKLNVTDTQASTEEYRKYFLSYLGLSSQVPNVVCSALNIFVQFGGSTLTFRIIGSILIETVIFIITVILAMLDSSTWAGAFFYITMASVVVLNMANGIYQNSLYGLAAKLPMKYSMSIVLGSNISGTFTSLILILSIAASPNQRTAAIYYFITALFVLLACVDTYFLLPLTRFYRYYDTSTNKQAISDSREVSQRPPYFKIFCKAWPQCFNVFLVFFVTLTIFPSIHASIKPIDKDFIIPNKYFTPVTCFLCFNSFAMLGSLLPNWIKWPGPRFLWIPVFLRFLMIPYFMLCNYIPDRRTIPVFITNDWAYIAMAVLLGLTSGYYSSLGMMYAPGCVDKEHAPIAGMMAALFLIMGIFSGVNFTFFISWLVERGLSLLINMF